MMWLCSRPTRRWGRGRLNSQRRRRQVVMRAALMEYRVTRGRRALFGRRRSLLRLAVSVLVLILALGCFLLARLFLLLFLPVVLVTSHRLSAVSRCSAGPKLGHVNLAKVNRKALWRGVLFIVVLSLSVIIVQVNNSGAFLFVRAVIEYVLMEIGVTCVFDGQ